MREANKCIDDHWPDAADAPAGLRLSDGYRFEKQITIVNIFIVHIISK